MNTLSWMIYAAEVAGSLKDMIGIASFVGLLIFGIWFLIMALAAASPYPDDMGKPPSVLLWGGLAGCFLASVTPSSTTIYMIAASEAGHAVATSEHGREILDAAREAIMAKLKEATQ